MVCSNTLRSSPYFAVWATARYSTWAISLSRTFRRALTSPLLTRRSKLRLCGRDAPIDLQSVCLTSPSSVSRQSCLLQYRATLGCKRFDPALVPAWSVAWWPSRGGSHFVLLQNRRPRGYHPSCRECLVCPHTLPTFREVWWHVEGSLAWLPGSALLSPIAARRSCRITTSGSRSSLPAWSFGHALVIHARRAANETSGRLVFWQSSHIAPLSQEGGVLLRDHWSTRQACEHAQRVPTNVLGWAAWLFFPLSRSGD